MHAALARSGALRPAVAGRPAARRPPPAHSLAAAPTNGTRVTALFKGFRGNSEDAGENGREKGLCPSNPTPPACSQRSGRPGCRVCLVLSYTPTAGATHAKTLCRIHPLSLTLSLLSSGVYGSQMGRDDFEPEDIDYYFEYTGSLAVRED